MTDLQLGLVVLGAVAVVGVLAYNRMQERAVRRDAERAFGGSHSDVLLEDAPAAKRDAAAGAAPFAHARKEIPPDALPDERLDYVILLRVPLGIPGATAIDSWRPIEQRFAKRAVLAGSEGAGWRRIVQGEFGNFSAFRAALQLVDRGGVVGDAELVEFRAAVETLAARIRAEITAPEMRQALDAARALDKLCADTDIQVALHVIGDGPESAAMEPALAGIADAPYQVARRPDGVTLVLDMPRTADVGRAYESMARTAVQLAAAMGGRVVDDRGTALEEASLAAIGVQLEAVRKRLVDAGIEPGSPLALRLFS